MRVAICVPSMATVHAEFAMALAALCRLCPLPSLTLLNERCATPAAARNALAARALDQGADWLLWLDSDMVFPPDCLERLLAHGRAIVGGVYPKRSPPHHVAARMSPDQSDAPDGMTRMELMGFGCLLVSAAVFRATPRPWFSIDLNGPVEVHEDGWFLNRARAAGFEAWCDDALTVELGHIGETTHRVPRLETLDARAAA